jgi:hypothetical protein
MRPLLLPVVLLASAVAALAACAEDAAPSELGRRAGAGAGAQAPAGASGADTASSPSGDAPSGAGAAATNSTSGKAYFTANVFPVLAAKCAACHEAGGAGNPTWLVKTDAARTYENIYANGWVLPAGSRILEKGVHAGGAAPALTEPERATVLTWIATEAKDGGNRSQVSVLEKLGGCLDPQLFAQIGLEKLQTSRRTEGNNTNAVTPWNENANTCTGCNAAPCRTCHSLDDATGFVMALGNPNVPASTTFEETKKILPPYLQKYVATGPDGTPVPSGGLGKKSDATRRDRAYTHPMFTIPADVQTRIDAFVNAALAKYAAGQCGK